jgi:hypothetical protein
MANKKSWLFVGPLLIVKHRLYLVEKSSERIITANFLFHHNKKQKATRLDSLLFIFKKLSTNLVFE